MKNRACNPASGSVFESDFVYAWSANKGEQEQTAKLAEGVGFEPTREQDPLPVFKTGALNHSATLPVPILPQCPSLRMRYAQLS